MGCHEQINTLQHWRDVRTLWNRWDPIGVSHICNEDEYDDYIRSTLQLLDQRETVEEIEKFLCFVAFELMGLELNELQNGTPKDFALSLKTWYENNC